MSALNGGNISKVTRIYVQAIVAVAAKSYHSIYPFRIRRKVLSGLTFTDQ